MILDGVKKKVYSNIGMRCKFIFHGSRNQNEEFFGTIVKMYPSIFLVELDNGTNRSFCYNDILISTLEIVS